MKTYIFNNQIFDTNLVDPSNKETAGLKKTKIQWRVLIKRMLHNMRTRHRLAYLNDAQLKDIGLNRADVYQELDKPLWK